MQLSLSISYGSSDGRCVVAIDYQHSRLYSKLFAFMTCAYIPEVVHQVSLLCLASRVMLHLSVMTKIACILPTVDLQPLVSVA